MPRELPGPQEYTLQPDYWDGHTLDDDCPPIEIRGSARNFIPNTRADRQEDKVKSEVKALLSQKGVIAGATSVKTFAVKGDFFDGTQYPLGTAVRLQEESLRDTTFGPVGRIYRWETRIGLIVDFGTPEKPFVQIASFPLGQSGIPEFDRHGVGLMHRDGAKILIREVEHYRDSFRIPGIRQPNSLERFTRIEVLELGEPQTEQVQGRSFLRRLLPRTS